MIEGNLLVLHNSRGWATTDGEEGVTWDYVANSTFVNLDKNEIEWTAWATSAFVCKRSVVIPGTNQKREEAVFLTNTGLKVLEYGTPWERTG